MKKLIWYVDRDEQISEAIKGEGPQIAEGYEVTTINNPIVIDERLKERLPDIIVMDISIAGQDEGSIIKDFKLHDETKKIPIILTAMDVKIEEKTRELGADDFLGKPFDVKQFMEKVDEVLKKDAGK